MKKDLSIIIPFAGEYPQAIFTVQAIAQSLMGKLNFEIIVVDNFCKELTDQWKVAKQRAANHLNKTIAGGREINLDDIETAVGMVPNMSNKSAEAFKASERGNEWLRYLSFDGRLSHWECKRQAVAVANSDTFLFIDAHTIPSQGIDEMYHAYNDKYRNIGSFHMPLTYKILEWHKLIYKMVVEKSFYGYSFTPFRDFSSPYKVPVMSCCGVMLSREILETIGGWPHHMFAYGGGENFLNYAMAVCGFDKYIYPHVTLHHHGDKRDYHYTYDGTLINRLTAHYLFGGVQCVIDLAQASRGNETTLKNMVHTIISNPEHEQQRALIKKNQKRSLSDFVSEWQKE